MRFRLSLFQLVPALCLAGCNINEDSSCTEQFEILTIEVVDNQGEPVVFDSVAVNRKADNVLFEFDFGSQEPGIYILMTDKYYHTVEPEGTTLTFAGFYDRNSLMLVDSYEYIVKRGICHIEKVSGADVIKLP